VRGDGVLLEVSARVLGAEAHVGIRGKVEDGVGPTNRVGQILRLHQVTPDEPEPGRLLRLGQKLLLPGREVVVADDVVAVSQQAVDQIARDETSAARYEVTHVRGLSLAGPRDSSIMALASAGLGG
jgi:hypothetical protein